MSDTMHIRAHEMKLAAPRMASSDNLLRCSALEAAAEALLSRKEQIFEANALDLVNAEKNQVAYQVRKRLAFNESKLQDVIAGIRSLIRLPDPVGRITLQRELDEQLTLSRISVPIGLIGVIFEARPDALVQISSLCIKSGNCAILKGGRETANTNRILFEVIHEAVVKAGLPEECLFLAQQHSEIDELLQCDSDVDLLIPRGSNQFVRYIMDHTKIPVMGHADGVCHIYVDETNDASAVLPILIDAKTQYPVACNAMETLLIQRSGASRLLAPLCEGLSAAGIRLHCTDEVLALLSGTVQKTADEIPADAFHTEYGDLELSVKLVADTAEAVDHINRFGSHHTDCILTRDDEAAAYFLRMVDSAGVYRNCSTRFADGFRYGFGAEVGISTGKLHARGPVGLEGLLTYKYVLEGSGQIVGDYASGKASFHFKELL